MITRSSSNSNNSCFSIGSLSVSHSILTVAGVIRRSSTTSIGLGKTGTRTTFAGRTRKSTLAMSQHPGKWCCDFGFDAEHISIFTFEIMCIYILV